VCSCRIRDSLLVCIALIFAYPCTVRADGLDTHIVAAAHALPHSARVQQTLRQPVATEHDLVPVHQTVQNPVATEHDLVPVLQTIQTPVAAEHDAVPVHQINQTPASAEHNAVTQAGHIVLLDPKLDSAEWSAFPEPATLDSQSEKRLKDGEVLVEAIDGGKTKFVLARIYIEQPPEDVWPILANPYEFENKICPRMKTVELISEKADSNVIKCGWNICLLIPKITYTVESKFEQQKQVQFRRIAGTFKEFRGSWMLRPLDGGKSCEVLYSMFIDPGIPLPKWIVREALKNELPQTLIGLRERVHAIYAQGALPEVRRPAAAGQLRPQTLPLPLAARKSSI
jgi:Polyketide cyclase / dehydrase and lipid transport